jgi:hypothetical protein
MRRLADPESALDARHHQVARHLAGGAGGRGQPVHDPSIAGIDSKQHMHDLAITTGELEVIGTPAEIRAQLQSRRRHACALLAGGCRSGGRRRPFAARCADTRRLGVNGNRVLRIMQANKLTLVHQPADQRQ